ncbi:MAG TPA: ABC transporter permease [Candidatus Angelobacter sp.]|nr:ABC transporter permease [Candidatus Angelobacter sp.]
MRSLQKTPGFAAMGIITLALGIAANTIVFSIVNASLLRPLPYISPDRLVIITWHNSQGRLTRDISAPAFFMLKERSRSFRDIAAVHGVNAGVNAGVNVAAMGSPQYKQAQQVSLEFFRTLGSSPVLGREFSPNEEQAGGPRVVILSYGLWEQDYNKDASAVGSEIHINGEPYSIVGIMQKGFQSYPDADLWLPLPLSSATLDAGNEYRVIARLRDGISLQDARQELASTADYRLTYPVRSIADDISLAPDQLQDFIVSGVRKSILSLFGAVIFVLLITCTNLALCLTVRGAARGHEFAIRAALGSSRRRLIRTFLMDGILICITGGVIGSIAGKELIPFISWFVPADLPLSGTIRMDMHVLLFVLTISVATAVLSGLTPAIRMSRVSLNDMIRQSAQTGSHSIQQTRLGRMLVTAQTSLTLLLLAGTASLLQNFLKLQSVQPGFDPHNVSVGQISLAPDRYTTTAATAQLLDRVIAQLKDVPGVESVASINGLPLEQGLGIPMYPADVQDSSPYGESQFRVVSANYFRTLRIPLLAGRFFSDRDDRGNKPVAIVSEGLARQWWPNQSPLGKMVAMGSELGSQFSDVPREVIGVVADVRQTGLEKLPPPTVFIDPKQAPDQITAFMNRLFPTSIVVRSDRYANVYESLRHALTGADRDLAIVSLRPLTQVVSTSLARPRFYVSLIGAFGAFALLLTAVGLYGILSYQLILRTREIAMRVAVGAKRPQVIGLIVKQGVGLVAIGILLGSAASIFLAKFLGTLIYNTPDATIGILATAALLLVTIAFLTSLVIAARATAIEPMVVLRAE